LDSILVANFDDMKRIHFILIILLGVFTEEILWSQNLIVNENFDEGYLNPSLWKIILDHPQVRDENQGISTFMRPENVEVSNGTAKLKLQYEPDCYAAWYYPSCALCGPTCNYPPGSTCTDPVQCIQQPGYCWCLVPEHFDFTSGQIVSVDQYLYGAFEIRCKIPPKAYPTFWLMGGCKEEIDVAEFLHCDNDKFSVSIHEAQYPNCDNSLYNTLGAAANTQVNCSDDFHTYTLIWTPNELAVLFDHKVKKKCSKDGLGACLSNYPNGSLYPNNPMNVLISICNSSCSPQDPQPQFEEIDYVRIWDYSSGYSDCDREVMLIDALAGNDPSQTYHVSNEITTYGNLTINSSESGHWSAGNDIELNDGFEVDGDFIAEIIPCMPSCIFCKEIDSTNSNNEINMIYESPLSANGVNHIENNGLNNNVIPENEKQKVSLTPNPTTGIFTIHNPFKEIYNVTITDAIGRDVTRTAIYNQHSDIDLSAQPKGIYFVKVQSESKIYIEKVIVQ
jgi:hypothetical protein